MSKSCLINKIVVVRLVSENHAMHIPEGKSGYLKHDGTYTTYDTPLTSSNTLANVLNDDEREFLESKLDSSRPKGWMSPYIQSNLNVWKGKHKHKVELSNEPLELHLSNPIDFIKYKILLTNKNDIASSFETRLDKKYLYYLEDKEDADKNKVEFISIKIKAHEVFSELSKSHDKIINALMVIYRGSESNVPNDMTENTAKTTLFNYVEGNPKQFIATLEDEEFKLKYILYRAIRRGVIYRNKHEYNLGMGDGRLVGKGISEVLAYIKSLSTDDRKQEEYIKFKAALK